MKYVIKLPDDSWGATHDVGRVLQGRKKRNEIYYQQKTESGHWGYALWCDDEAVRYPGLCVRMKNHE